MRNDKTLFISMNYISDLSTVSTSEEYGATKPLPVTFN